MIIAQSPLRISLGGGGTDLPSYYREHEGFLIAAAINKYVYVTVTRPFWQGIFLKYSELENVHSVSEIKHPIFRHAMQVANLSSNQIEVTSLADIPTGTGLGSSGSFTTALLLALHAYHHRFIDKNKLAELACHIEINELGEPIGKQDQYIAAFGGLTCFTFHQDDTVTSSSLNVSKETLYELEDNLLLFFTGATRRASDLLLDQNERTLQGDEQLIDNLNFIKKLAGRVKEALEAGNCEQFGELMHEHWEYKKQRSKRMSSEAINAWYELGLKQGAVGGKLVGAGGGGFLMFYAKDPNQLRWAMRKEGLEEVRFGFDFEGSKLILS